VYGTVARVVYSRTFPGLIKPQTGRLNKSPHIVHAIANRPRRAKIATILEELAIRGMENATRLEKAKEKRLRAEEKVIRDKAQIAFIAAGGTRGDFAREWPSVFLEEVRGARTLADARGH